MVVLKKLDEFGSKTNIFENQNCVSTDRVQEEQCYLILEALCIVYAGLPRGDVSMWPQDRPGSDLRGERPASGCARLCEASVPP